MKPHLLIAQVDCDSEIALASHYKSPITSDLQNVYYKTLYVFKDIFRRHAIQGTFFVVGKDLESETKCERVTKLPTIHTRTPVIYLLRTVSKFLMRFKELIRYVPKNWA